MPQLLRVDARLHNCHVRRAAPLYLASQEGDQELRVESRVVVHERVLRDWRAVVSGVLRLETGIFQRPANIAVHGCMQRKRNIDVSRPERGVCRHAGQRVQTVKAMCPAPDDDEVAKPGSQGLDQPGESGGVVHLIPSAR